MYYNPQISRYKMKNTLRILSLVAFGSRDCCKVVRISVKAYSPCILRSTYVVTKVPEEAPNPW